MVNNEILKRKGASKTKDVPNEILDLLNKGEIETVNLVEWLVVDFAELVINTFGEIGLSHQINSITRAISDHPDPKATKITKLISEMLVELETDHIALEEKLFEHRSDLIRSFGAYVLGRSNEISNKDKFKRIRKYAADPHFGIREFAWEAVRHVIIDDLDKSIKELEKWSLNKDPNIRRFASEATRPRGVWTKHIYELRDNPEKAINILEPLKNDPEKYVKDSVGNWLNDASKTRPDWVEEICDRWLKESKTSNTEYIVARALRTIRKG